MNADKNRCLIRVHRRSSAANIVFRNFRASSRPRRVLFLQLLSERVRLGTESRGRRTSRIPKKAGLPQMYTARRIVYETKPISHKALTIKGRGPFERRLAGAGSSFDPEMELEDGIVVFGGDALAAGHSLREPGGLARGSLLDAAFASQDVATESKSAGIGNALVGAGHGKFSVVTFREIGKNRHSIHLGFRVAVRNQGNACCQTYVFDS